MGRPGSRPDQVLDHSGWWLGRGRRQLGQRGPGRGLGGPGGVGAGSSGPGRAWARPGPGGRGLVRGRGGWARARPGPGRAWARPGPAAARPGPAKRAPGDKDGPGEPDCQQRPAYDPEVLRRGRRPTVAAIGGPRRRGRAARCPRPRPRLRPIHDQGDCALGLLHHVVSCGGTAWTMPRALGRGRGRWAGAASRRTRPNSPGRLSAQRSRDDRSRADH
jgi:hypothetical protein